MIGSIISGVLSIGSAIAGGISSSVQARKATEERERQRQKNQNWYDLEMNRDYTQRADAQNALNRMRDIYLERNKNVEAAQAVTGASDEKAALAKEASNEAIADAASNIAAQASAHKDNVAAEYRQVDNNLSQQQQQIYAQKAQNIQNAVGQATQAAASIAGSVGGPSKSHFTPSPNIGGLDLQINHGPEDYNQQLTNNIVQKLNR